VVAINQILPLLQYLCSGRKDILKKVITAERGYDFYLITLLNKTEKGWEALQINNQIL